MITHRQVSERSDPGPQCAVTGRAGDLSSNPDPRKNFSPTATTQLNRVMLI